MSRLNWEVGLEIFMLLCGIGYVYVGGVRGSSLLAIAGIAIVILVMEVNRYRRAAEELSESASQTTEE